MMIAQVVRRDLESPMQIRGIVRTATLAENPPGTDEIEMTLRVQGVGAGQPRLLIVPYELLLQNPSLDPEVVMGKGFQAEVVELEPGRWVVVDISLASGRVLRELEP
jgi:hypothetical protein